MSMAEEVDTGRVRLIWGVEIPMRDKTSLSALLYLPETSTPAPAIFVLTPYIAQRYHEEGVYFASHGYPFLAVDVRGRGNSGGEFYPLRNEGRDGHDVTEWIARQTYCDSKVAMWGGSYQGHDQWTTAAENPPHLASIAPTAAPYMGVDFPMRNNIFFPYLMQWLTLVAGRTSQENVFSHGAAFWGQKFRQAFESGLAFEGLDAFLDHPSGIFREWIRHPQQDAFWDTFNPTPDVYAQIHVPVLTITGSHDDDQPGALEHYRRHTLATSGRVEARHFLVIGPWDHAGCRVPQQSFAGLTIGDAGVTDLRKLHLQWYEWTMRGGPRPEFLRKAVSYYVMGAEEWRHADSLQDVTSRVWSLYLTSDGDPTDVFHAGILARSPPAGSSAGRYVYDPKDVSLAALEADMEPVSLTDQRMIYAASGRQLIYHSEPLETELDVCGFFHLNAWISLDQVDTDMRVIVCEIRQDGTSIQLSSDLMRARYRESLRSASFPPIGAVVLYEFTRFTFVARRLTKGSRLRLVISPGNSINAQKNYNAGGEVSRESLRDARSVTVSLHQGDQYRSVLCVPVGRSEPVELSTIGVGTEGSEK
jgi:uncharacterized protein